MKHISRAILRTLAIIVFSSGTLFSPNIVRAINIGDATQQVSGDCVLVGVETWAAAKTESLVSGAVSIANNVTSVPISNILIENSTATSDAYAGKIEPWYTCIGYSIGQLVLKELTDQTIAWIRGGFNGSPSYSIDTHKLFTDLADMVASTLARDIRNYNMCDFRVGYKNDLANWVETSGNDRAKLPERYACPFQDEFNFTASELYGNFQKGGWKFFEKTLNDNGNPFGVAVMTAGELTRAQEQEVRIQEQRLSWGAGFLEIIDEDKCIYPEGITKEMVDEMATSGNSAAAVSYKKSYCGVTTPGKAIESAMTEYSKVSWDRLKLADNLSKITAALINRLSDDAIKSVFKKEN
ncbi:MAG: hypothetical protein Q7K40_01735 [bacterium]|nr:hypothetical protein [bacterium]